MIQERNIDNSTPMFTEYPDVVSVDELQEMLKVGRSIAYKLLKDNHIKTIRIGNKYIIPKKSVINFIDSSILDGNVILS